MIGKTRWDRDCARRRGSAPSRSRSAQPEPFWGSDPRRNAHLLGPNRASFYDPKLPAWFELTVDRAPAACSRLRMTAQSHFMRHRYSGFDAAVRDRATDSVRNTRGLIPGG